jgi:hypothetical protein
LTFEYRKAGRLLELFPDGKPVRNGGRNVKLFCQTNPSVGIFSKSKNVKFPNEVNPANVENKDIMGEPAPLMVRIPGLFSGSGLGSRSAWFLGHS